MNNRYGYVNYGNSSRSKYDESYYHDDVEQMTRPNSMVMDATKYNNCSKCFTGFGPRGSWGVSLAEQNPSVTPKQDLTDIESVMKNLNVKHSRDKKGKVNPINVLKYNTYNQPECGKYLDPVSSLLVRPKALDREMSINRFIDLNNNPQQHIFWNFSENTTLTAKDNYVPQKPHSLPKDDYPSKYKEAFKSYQGDNYPHYNFGSSVPVFDIKTYPNINRQINPDFVSYDDILSSDSDKDIQTDSD